MRRTVSSILLAAIAGSVLSIAPSIARAEPLGTAFSYQGELRALPGNTVINGPATIRFRLFDALTGGNQIFNGQVSAVTLERPVTLVDGRFTVTDLEFGDSFGTDARYLEVTVIRAGQPDQVLAPRQRVGPGPAATFALKSGSAATATTAASANFATNAQNATNLSGQPGSNYLNTANSTQVGAFLTSASVARTNAVNTFSQNTTFSGRVGLGTAAPVAPLHIFSSDQTIANFDGSNAGGVWLTLVNRAAGGKNYSLVSTGASNSEGAGHLLVRNNTDNIVPLSILGSGRVGVGTSAPGAGYVAGQEFDKFEVAGPDAGLRVRNINDNTGGVAWNSFGALHLGLYNPTAAAIDQVPANARRAFFSMSRDGRVGSTTNTGGEPIFRNILDDGAGRVGIGTTAPQAQFHLRGPGTFLGNHVALFENSSPSNGDGIAIKVGDLNPSAQNNFVTFVDFNNNVRGRIEGFLSFTDWVFPPAPPALTPTINITARPLNQWWNAGTLPSHTWNPGTPASVSPTTTNILGVNVLTGVGFNSGTAPSFTFNSGTLPTPNGQLPITIGNPAITFPPPSVSQLSAMYCWSNQYGISQLNSFDPTSLASWGNAIAELRTCKDGGVTYGSKGADYAEWLERADHAEDIRYGHIVGVRGGKVSKRTSSAEHCMIVTNQPIVLGNTPPAGQEANFEKISFMGQVPCIVRGQVGVGDFIVPSGLNDGTGVAVAPAKLTASLADRVVGRAWSSSTSNDFGIVNVAVGLNANETAHLVRAQQDEIDTLKRDASAMRAELDQLKSDQARLLAAVQRLEAATAAPRKSGSFNVR